MRPGNMRKLEMWAIPQALSIAVGLTIAITFASALSPAEARELRVARQTSTDQARDLRADGERVARSPTTCAANYHRGLQQVKSTAGEKLQSSADGARRGDYRLPGSWLFWKPGSSAVHRKLARIGAQSSVIVVEDRICTRSVLGRGGRIRCLKWEPKPKNFQPPKLTDSPRGWGGEPGAGPEARKHIAALADFVRSGGAVKVLQRRGRLHELTKRVGGELLGFLGQPPRATLCTGGPAMIGFYARQLSPLTSRVSAANNLTAASLRQARKRAALALDSWNRDTGRDEVLSAGRSDATDKPEKIDITQSSKELEALILATAKIMLPRELVSYIEAETDNFDRLVRAREAMSADAASEAPPHVRSDVFRAFRAIEIAYYAEKRLAAFEGYAGSLEDILEAIGTTHQRDCTCE